MCVWGGELNNKKAKNMNTQFRKQSFSGQWAYKGMINFTKNWSRAKENSDEKEFLPIRFPKN